MTSISGLQYAKHKSVYGKKGGRGYNTTNLKSFFDDDEDELVSAPTVARQSSVKATYPVQKTETKPQERTSKLVRPKAKRQNTFDVPTSSDDEISSPPKTISPFKYRVALADDTDTSNAPLSPWEKKRQEATQSSRNAQAKRQRTPEGSPEAQLKQELRHATLSPESPSRTPKGKESESQRTSAITSPNSSSEVKGLSAAARLAARRALVEKSTPSSADERFKPVHAVPKRSVLASDESESTPRKRARTVAEAKDSADDVLMADADEDTAYDYGQQSNATNDTNIYDFPATSDDELKAPKRLVKSPKASTKLPRRNKLTTYKSRTMNSQGSSAPSRLAEMIATDTDTTEPSTRSPSEAPSVKSTKHAPSTPPSARIGSPETALKAAGTMTPKQAQLWDRLLPSDTAVPSPSALAMKDLTISAKRRNAAPPAVVRRLTKSQSDVPRRRLRLVDRLKASAPSSDNGSDNEDTDDTDMADGDVSVDENLPKDNVSATEKAQSQASRSQSQSETQSKVVTNKTSMKTYASVRSHLDDSIDEIMFGLTADSAHDSPATKPAAKTAASMSQKSAFDMDDSDDEGGKDRIRTIHELRASGAHTHTMWDIEEALEDIKQHGPSQRGRRRTALIELATKLSDKAFVARFVGQSCELRLVAECGACSDEIADFILASGISLMLASDPSDHAVENLQEQGLMPWLAGLLDQDSAISKLGKERRNNMSKASQTSLAEFSNMIKSQPLLWNEDKPQTVSPRIVALKALDQITRRLRKMGDKSELLTADQLSKILRDSDVAVEHTDQVHLVLSVSVLESLSTASLSLHWPAPILHNVGSMLTELEATSSLLRHAQFLALRLCLNLTNENKRNCKLLTSDSRSSIVALLLDGIQSGYAQLATETNDEKRTVALDLLVLAIGIMINLAEHCNEAPSLAVQDSELLGQLVEVFKQGQRHMLDAESVEESISNVTFGYLAVMLANLCQSQWTKAFIASKLPGQNLRMLIEAVEEFVLHHQKVDTMNFEGEEGKEVWGAFTEKLKAVLARLKEADQGVRL